MLKLHTFISVYIYIVKVAISIIVYIYIHTLTDTWFYLKYCLFFPLNCAQTMAYSLRKEQMKKYYILHSSRLNGTESTLKLWTFQINTENYIQFVNYTTILPCIYISKEFILELSSVKLTVLKVLH